MFDMRTYRLWLRRVVNLTGQQPKHAGCNPGELIRSWSGFPPPFGSGATLGFACEKFHKRLDSRREAGRTKPVGLRAKASGGARHRAPPRWSPGLAVGIQFAASFCPVRRARGLTGRFDSSPLFLLLGLFVGGGGRSTAYRRLMARERKMTGDRRERARGAAGAIRAVAGAVLRCSSLAWRWSLRRPRAAPGRAGQRLARGGGAARDVRHRAAGGPPERGGGVGTRGAAALRGGRDVGRSSG